MHEELSALRLNKTWDLFTRTENMKVVACKWVFKTKLKSDGSLERLKAHLIAKGFNQVEGVDFSETFSPVIKPGSVRIVLTVATINKCPIRQLDVKKAFLHGFLNESVYMKQPPGFINLAFASYSRRPFLDLNKPHESALIGSTHFFLAWVSSIVRLIHHFLSVILVTALSSFFM